MKLVTVVGARPQFIKAAVVSRVIREWNAQGSCEAIDEIIIHTGQHFDPNMSDVFFREMDIPHPQHHLGLGGGGHGEMTGRMLEGIERVLLSERPDWVLVYGDTNSTLAGALAAVKLHIPVAHVEAGLRSFNRRMPEEINRVLTDHAADLLFVPTEVAERNLLKEGIAPSLLERVGDVMYDAMLFYRGIAAKTSDVLQSLGLSPRGFILATIHRAENTDDPARLAGVMDGLRDLSAELPVILPLHPRTRKALHQDGLLRETESEVRIIEPVGYIDMVMLESAAALIATDSGGVQKEAYFNGVPCLTLRDETEWVELIHAGANVLVGANRATIAKRGRAALARPVANTLLYGDGRAGQAIITRLMQRRSVEATCGAMST
jgi:UDP-GlcNAc3NAcA epimerase